LRNEWITDLKILLPVKYHNKKTLTYLDQDKEYLNLQKHEQEEIDILSKLIRDADKLDNIEYFIFDFDRIKFIYDNYLSNWKYDNSISDDILNVFLQKKSINNNNVKTFVEHILTMLSRIFDINYLWTKKLLKTIWYCNIIPDKLESGYWVPHKQIQQIKNILNSSLEE
jgi:hypothetical protein